MTLVYLIIPDSKDYYVCGFSHLSTVQLCEPMHYSPLGSSVHGILQARILEWVAMPSSRASSRPGDQIQVSCITGRFFIDEPRRKPKDYYGPAKHTREVTCKVSFWSKVEKKNFNTICNELEIADYIQI